MEKICPTCQREFSDDVVFCPHDGMKLRTRRAPGDDPMIGRVLDGRWVIESLLGIGGMGAVYKGHQRSVDRTVAIKTLRSSLVDTDDFVDRFFREARVATTINHPHCVTIHDFGQDEDGTLYLAMEYLEGETLTERISEGTLTLEEILLIGMQISSALSAAHDAKIVHRDLKPDNIFLLDIPGGGTFVKVLDFGIAKVLGADTQMTRTGQVFGTPSYMSPEQCQGHAIDGRSDLYSLGCILYELVGGRPPFEGETPMAVLMAHVVNDVPSLAGLIADGKRVDSRIERFIMSLLAKDPDNRPASAAEARSQLEAISSTLKSDELAHRTADFSAVFADEVTLTPREQPFSTAELNAQAGLTPGRGRRALVVLLVLTLLTLAAGLVGMKVLLADGDEAPTISAVSEEDDSALAHDVETQESDLAAASQATGTATEEATETVQAARDLAAEETTQEQSEDDVAEAKQAQPEVEPETTARNARVRTEPRTETRRPPRQRTEPVRRAAPEPTPQEEPRPAPTQPEPTREEPNDDPLDFFGQD